jgi:hypothetical protein
VWRKPEALSALRIAVVGIGLRPVLRPQCIETEPGPRAGQFVLEDWFAPWDIRDSNKNDVDLCAGPVLLPWGGLVGAWGKDRAYYMMDRNGMGHFRPTENAIAQFAPNMTKAQNPGQEGGTGHIHCAPVVFADPDIGPVSYVWGENDGLRGYRFDVGTSKFETQTPATLLSENLLPIGMPGGMLTVYCNGTHPGTGVLWALHPIEGNANHATVAGMLQAYRGAVSRFPDSPQPLTPQAGQTNPFAQRARNK